MASGSGREGATGAVAKGAAKLVKAAGGATGKGAPGGDTAGAD